MTSPKAVADVEALSPAWARAAGTARMVCASVGKTGVVCSDRSGLVVAGCCSCTSTTVEDARGVVLAGERYGDGKYRPEQRVALRTASTHGVTVHTMIEAGHHQTARCAALERVGSSDFGIIGTRTTGGGDADAAAVQLP